MPHYFTADTHFGDDSIRRFFGRPFRSDAEMDAALVAGFSGLNADDHLWIIGDFAACDRDEQKAGARGAFDAIPGRKHLVRGNHDPDWVCRNLGWESVHDLVEIDVGDRRLVLCHYPLITWNGVRDGVIHLFGHVHDRWPGAQGQVNVGVDLWQFRPVGIDEAELAALTLPPSPLMREVERLAD